MEIAGVDVEIDVIKEYPELEDLVVDPSTEDQSFNSSKYGFKSVKINAIKGDKLDLNPSLEKQNVKGVFTEVNINPIQTEKLNTVPTTQEQVLTGLFDEVIVNAIEGEKLNLNPSEKQQNYEGVFLGVNINPIQVEEVTTDLDFSSSDVIEVKAQEGTYIKKTKINKPTNLNPENIKSGETVCGIAGTNADTSDADATSNDIIAGKTAYVANEKIAGTYIPLDTSDATATAKDIAKDKTAYVNGEKVIGTLMAGEYNAVLEGQLKAGNTASQASGRSYVHQLIKELPPDLTISGTSAQYMFQNCSSLEKIPLLDTSNITNMSHMFTGCQSLKEIALINTSKATTMQNMFNNCKALKTVPLLDTKNVTIVSAMFQGCISLETVPALDFSSSKGFNNTFNGCTNLKEVSIITSSKNTDLLATFYKCSSLTNVPEINTENVTVMQTTFSECTSLKEIPLWNTSKVNTMQYMCKGCTVLETVPLLDTSLVVNFAEAFTNCPNLTDESLNNILQMCANATKSYTKTLKYIGLSSDQATRCQSLSNYQSFLDARLDHRILKKEKHMILEIIIKWAIPFILGTVVTGIISYIKNKVAKDKSEDIAIKEAVQALLRNELIRRYREYEIKGELSILDKENIEAMFKQYKNLGGNGTVEKLYDELLDLHTKIVR